MLGGEFLSDWTLGSQLKKPGALVPEFIFVGANYLKVCWVLRR